MQRHAIYSVLGSVLVLICIGIVMLFSTSAFAPDGNNDMLHFIKKQSQWLVIGVAACVFAALVDYHWWQRTWYLWLGGSVVLLVLCFVPPIGMKINGSWRWLNLHFFTLQPSELAKIAVVFFLAWWFARFEARSKTLLHGFLLPALVVAVPLGLIAAEVDLGTAALVGAVMFGMMFVAGTRLLWLAPVVAGGIAAVLALAISIPQRLERLLAFMQPEKYRLAEGLQQWQALIALGSGGLDGLGLGQGRQKMLYLPYAHTDFIFPMIGEELGLKFTLLVVFCFLLLTLGGCAVAINARDRFGMLAGFGAVTIIGLQAAINIGVTTSLLPNKGMPLPFISYGGSNLVVCLFLVGLLISIHRQRRPEPEQHLAPVMEYRPAMRW